MIKIDTRNYNEIPVEAFPFGNKCSHCAFYGTGCYNRLDFSCHSDEREDGKDIVFVETKQETKDINEPILETG